MGKYLLSNFIFSNLSVIITLLLLDHGKKEKSLFLAPIAVEILISRGSAYKIETKSGTIFPKKPNLSAPLYSDL